MNTEFKYTTFIYHENDALHVYCIIFESRFGQHIVQSHVYNKLSKD